ncbi:MAG: hypothetical protein ACTS7E_04630 [Arsenophonus sp. NC-CH8-MAG3]
MVFRMQQQKYSRTRGIPQRYWGWCGVHKTTHLLPSPQRHLAPKVKDELLDSSG